MSKTKIDINEIPYDLLEEYGLTQEMVDDLPQSVMDKLLAGKRTPVLPFVIDGKQQKARISLVKVEDSVDILVMPYSSLINMDGFTEEEQRVLRNGNALLANKDGVETYYQLDDSTNQIISCQKSIIAHNMEILKNQMKLEDGDLLSMQNGDVVTLSRDGGEVSYKIDLNDLNGIKVTKGNKYDVSLHEEKLPHYSFGIYGCWVNDEGGVLSYVEEDKYSQEMQDVQNEIVKNARKGIHR